MKDTGWISLTFDDALDQHLDVALPAMDAAGLPGTFYVPLSAPGFHRRLTDWSSAAERGHELGNHTVFHPALSSKSWVRPGNAIDRYSLDRMRMELEFANDFLTSLDGQSRRTFAYPCSNSYIGHTGWGHAALRWMKCDRTRLAGWVDRFQLDLGATRQSYASIVGEIFPAGRGGGLERNDVVPPVGQWSRTSLLSVAVDGWSLRDLQAHVSGALQHGTWAILQFHGVGGGHRLDCDATVFSDFVSWLGTEHPMRVITVVEGARRLWPEQFSQEILPAVNSISMDSAGTTL